MPQYSSLISDPLAALMQLKQAEQALAQGANPLVPSTGGLSVAGQAIQSAQALTQPQQPQPQMGIEDLLPGVQQQAMMQAQQPVTQAQLAQAMQQAQGIAAGPQDISMAEGGIVGFSGEFGSVVPEAEALDALRVEEARRKRELVEKQQMAEFLAQAGAPQAAEYAQYLPVKAPAPEIAGQERGKEMRYPPRFPDSVTESKKKTTSSSASSASAPSASDKVGIAQLTQPSWISFLQAGLDANRAQVLPEKITEKRAEEIRREAMIRRGIDPDYYKVRQREIDELQAAYAKEEADRAKMVEGRGLENLIGFLTRVGGAKSLARGLGQASRGMESVVEKQRLSDQEFRRLMMERQKAIGDSRAAIQQFREAQALGDLKTQADSTKEYNEAINRQKATEAKMYGDVVAPMIQSETAALDRASREKMEGMRLRQQAEQNNQMQLANRINAANITVSAAIEKMEGSLKKKYGTTADLFRMLPKSEIDKKPELAASYAEYKKESEKMFAEMVEPAIAERNRLAAMVSGGGENAQRYDSQGNRIK